jgi:hypothetical protein
MKVSLTYVLHPAESREESKSAERLRLNHKLNVGN